MREWVTERGAAEYLALAAGTLRNWRLYGLGPAFVKLPNGSIRYDVAELERWALSSTQAA